MPRRRQILCGFRVTAKVRVMLDMVMLVMVFGNILWPHRVTDMIVYRIRMQDALLLVLVFLKGKVETVVQGGNIGLESFCLLEIIRSPTCQGSISQRSKHVVSGSSQQSSQ